MDRNPFDIVKAEEFNHGFDELATLMHFGTTLAGSLLSASNVFLDGSRGSGKSMHLRLLSIQAKTTYERLAAREMVDPLPKHKPFLGVYMKLAPTLVGPHEYEQRPGFREAFQEFFNVYAMENIVQALLELAEHDLCHVADESAVAEELAAAALCSGRTFRDVWHTLRTERHDLRQRLNGKTYAARKRAHPEVLWEFAEILSQTKAFRAQRVHLLVDEYDNLSELQQRVLNTYLRKRDFPVTFKVACRKHRLVTHDIYDRPLTESGDFTRVSLDDERLGLGKAFASYVEAIANKRLRNAGVAKNIREFLGKSQSGKPRAKGQRRYSGFEQLVVLSSGIVRTFLELCRDIYSEAPESASWPVRVTVQDGVVNTLAANRWNSLSTDMSARPELQRLIEQVALLFKAKSRRGVERQIIRLEIVDFFQATSFLRQLLEAALDYEAFIKPNRERVQKNTGIPSRGYLLHRLLCVHFRLEPESRWDFEISSANLEGLVTQRKRSSEILAQPTKREERAAGGLTTPLFGPYCPIRDEVCERRDPEDGTGFLSCRLPTAGIIRDAIGLIKDAFATAKPAGRYRVLTAEDFPPGGDIACKVCAAVGRSSFVLVEFSKYSPSVAMELGFCVARGIPTYLLFNEEEQREVDEPFSSIEYLSYSVTSKSVRGLVERQIVPFLGDGGGGRTIQIGPVVSEIAESETDVFVALPDEAYYRETLLPEIEGVLRKRTLRVRTEWQGRALHDLERAAAATCFRPVGCYANLGLERKDSLL